jgi:hypothetical protein
VALAAERHFWHYRQHPRAPPLLLLYPFLIRALQAAALIYPR